MKYLSYATLLATFFLHSSSIVAMSQEFVSPAQCEPVQCDTHINATPEHCVPSEFNEKNNARATVELVLILEDFKNSPETRIDEIKKLMSQGANPNTHYHRIATGNHIDFKLNADTTQRLPDEIPLGVAARYDSVALVTCLLDHGARANERTAIDKSTPFMSAGSNVAEILLQRGAHPDDQDLFGNTALHYAAAVGDNEKARWLLSHGADTTIKNMYGRTALTEARLYGQRDLAQMLFEAGATE